MADEQKPEKEQRSPEQEAPRPEARPAGPRREAGPGGPRRGKRQFFRKKKVCRFCVEKIDFIDYKRVELLAPFVQERGKILPRRMTGTCSRHQRWLGMAIKRARNIALLPFSGGVEGSGSTHQHRERGERGREVREREPKEREKES